MKENENQDKKILDKISELSGVRFSFKRLKDGKFSVVLKHGSFKKVFFYDSSVFSTNKWNNCPNSITIVMNEKEPEIPIERYLIMAIKSLNLRSLCGNRRKTGDLECIFDIPEFSSISELAMKLDMY